jgi:hypothetical protein
MNKYLFLFLYCLAIVGCTYMALREHTQKQRAAIQQFHSQNIKVITVEVIMDGERTAQAVPIESAGDSILRINIDNGEIWKIKSERSDELNLSVSGYSYP